MHSSSRRGKKRKLDVSEKGGEDAVPDSPTKDVHNYETVCALFEAADKYEVNRLRLLCEHILTTMLSPASIQHILNVADKHGAAQLKKICLDFIAQNPDELIGSDAFSSLDPSMMKQLVACVLARQKGSELSIIPLKLKVELTLNPSYCYNFDDESRYVLSFLLCILKRPQIPNQSAVKAYWTDRILTCTRFEESWPSVAFRQPVAR